MRFDIFNVPDIFRKYFIPSHEIYHHNSRNSKSVDMHIILSKNKLHAVHYNMMVSEGIDILWSYFDFL